MLIQVCALIAALNGNAPHGHLVTRSVIHQAVNRLHHRIALALLHRHRLVKVNRVCARQRQLLSLLRHQRAVVWVFRLVAQQVDVHIRARSRNAGKSRDALDTHVLLGGEHIGDRYLTRRQ